MTEYKADPETAVLADPTIHDMYSTYTGQQCVGAELIRECLNFATNAGMKKFTWKAFRR